MKKLIYKYIGRKSVLKKIIKHMIKEMEASRLSISSKELKEKRDDEEYNTDTDKNTAIYYPHK